MIRFSLQQGHNARREGRTEQDRPEERSEEGRGDRTENRTARIDSNTSNSCSV
jgi:hypothetical protein